VYAARVRILGIETSSSRGSVALVEGRHRVALATHSRENAHGESIQPLIERALAEAGWQASALDRISVGIGPGSFTGLRVGVALAKGIAEGLERPLIGVSSLAAMALGAPADLSGMRCPVLDARRGELFFALYAPDGRCLREPGLAENAAAIERALNGLEPAPILLGSACPALARGHIHRDEETDLPHAVWTALAALDAAPGEPVAPCYLRDAVAVVPSLPSNPLAGDHRR
jgi:tRNA threonylcarbamoyl adenosine modification protein YeaZ